MQAPNGWPPGGAFEDDDASMSALATVIMTDEEFSDSDDGSVVLSEKVVHEKSALQNTIDEIMAKYSVSADDAYALSQHLRQLEEITASPNNRKKRSSSSSPPHVAASSSRKLGENAANAISSNNNDMNVERREPPKKRKADVELVPSQEEPLNSVNQTRHYKVDYCPSNREDVTIKKAASLGMSWAESRVLCALLHSPIGSKQRIRQGVSPFSIPLSVESGTTEQELWRKPPSKRSKKDESKGNDSGEDEMDGPSSTISVPWMRILPSELEVMIWSFLSSLQHHNDGSLSHVKDRSDVVWLKLCISQGRGSTTKLSLTCLNVPEHEAAENTLPLAVYNSRSTAFNSISEMVFGPIFSALQELHEEGFSVAVRGIDAASVNPLQQPPQLPIQVKPQFDDVKHNFSSSMMVTASGLQGDINLNDLILGGFQILEQAQIRLASGGKRAELLLLGGNAAFKLQGVVPITDFGGWIGVDRVNNNSAVCSVSIQNGTFSLDEMKCTEANGVFRLVRCVAKRMLEIQVVDVSVVIFGVYHRFTGKRVRIYLEGGRTVVQVRSNNGSYLPVPIRRRPGMELSDIKTVQLFLSTNVQATLDILGLSKGRPRFPCPYCLSPLFQPRNENLLGAEERTYVHMATCVHLRKKAERKRESIRDWEVYNVKKPALFALDPSSFASPSIEDTLAQVGSLLVQLVLHVCNKVDATVDKHRAAKYESEMNALRAKFASYFSTLTVVRKLIHEIETLPSIIENKSETTLRLRLLKSEEAILLKAQHEVWACITDAKKAATPCVRALDGTLNKWGIDRYHHRFFRLSSGDVDAVFASDESVAELELAIHANQTVALHPACAHIQQDLLVLKPLFLEMLSRFRCLRGWVRENRFLSEAEIAVVQVDILQFLESYETLAHAKANKLCHIINPKHPLPPRPIHTIVAHWPQWIERFGSLGIFTEQKNENSDQLYAGTNIFVSEEEKKNSKNGKEEMDAEEDIMKQPHLALKEDIRIYRAKARGVSVAAQPPPQKEKRVRAGAR